MPMGRTALMVRTVRKGQMALKGPTGQKARKGPTGLMVQTALRRLMPMPKPQAKGLLRPKPDRQSWFSEERDAS